MVSITGIFHIANIIGAYRTAEYKNNKEKLIFMENIREKVFSIDY